MSETIHMDKARLASYASLRLEIDNQLDRLARMKNEAEIPAQKPGDGSQHNPGAGDRMERAIIRYMEYEERVRPQIEEARAKMLEIETAINAIPDPLEREVLRLRYLDGDGCRLTPWRIVSQRLFGDDDERHILATYRLHGRALVSISAKR